MRNSWWIGLLLLALTACGGAGDDKSDAPATPSASTSPSEAVESPSAEPQTTDPSESTAPTMSGNARRNPACRLLSLDEVTAASRLDVIGVLGLPADKTNPDKRSESCTWFLDPKIIQSSLVVQYTLYDQPPAELIAYYPQVIAQGFGKAVPRLGDSSKIDGHVLDTIYRRAEIHVTLLTHAEATRADQKAAIALMRRVMTGLRQ